MRLWIAIALLTTFAPAVYPAQPFHVAMSGYQTGFCGIQPGVIVNGPVYWLGGPDRFRGDLDPEIDKIASADGQRVLGLERTYTSETRLLELSPDGSSRVFFDGLKGYGRFSFAVAKSGHVFVAIADQLNRSSIAVIAPGGTLEAIYPLQVGGELAVANDGCTVLFAKPGGIGRVNACTGAALADYLATTDDIFDIQVVPDGDVLVAANHSVALYDASGAFVRQVVNLRDSYPQEIAIGPGDQTLWIATGDSCSDAELLRVSTINGQEISRRFIGNFNNVTGLVIGAAVPASVPTLQPFALALIAAGLAVFGALVIRTR
jgi:hypothetical protein